MAVELSDRDGSMGIELVPGRVYEGDDGCAFRVRGVQDGLVIADEIGPKKAFSVGSQYHGRVREIELPLPTDNRSRSEFMNDTSLKSLREMRDYWLGQAVEYQNLAHSRRSIFAKAGDVLGFFLLVIPYRLFARMRGYRGPFS